MKKKPKQKSIINNKEFFKARMEYIHTADERRKEELRFQYPEFCEDEKLGLSTEFSTRNLFGDQLIVKNNGKQLCRLTLMIHYDEDLLGIGINDDGSGIRFKLVNGKGKYRAEQYLVPIFPKKKKTIKKL